MREPANAIFLMVYSFTLPFAETARPIASCARIILEPRHLTTWTEPFGVHPNLSDQVNNNIAQSEIEGGVYLDHLPFECTLEIETQNRRYTLVNLGQGRALLCGHPLFCPQPVLVTIEGCSWGGSMLKSAYLGRGMHLEFRHPQYETPIVTSRIVDIRPTKDEKTTR